MHPFDDPWPPFLDLIDSKPKKCMTVFWEFAYRQLGACPPTLIRGVPRDDRADLESEIVLHCLSDNFRILRSYRNMGRPFACWFAQIANRQILMWYRRQKLIPLLLDDFIEDVDKGSELVDPRPFLTPEQKKAVLIVEDCIRALKERCQLLLRLAGEEFKPGEIAILMGVGVATAPEISESLRQCRKRLAQLALERGFDPTLKGW